MRPQNGAAINWHNEYAPMMGVIHSGGALNRTPMYGTSGIRIPKPRMSITLTMKSEPSRAFIKDGASVIRNQLPDIGTRPRGRRNEVARCADDEVGNAPVIPVRIDPQAGAQDGELQRRHQPEPVRAAADQEYLISYIRRHTRLRVSTQAQIRGVVGVGRHRLQQLRHPARPDDLTALIVAVSQQNLGDPKPVTLAREESRIDVSVARGAVVDPDRRTMGTDG